MVKAPHLLTATDVGHQRSLKQRLAFLIWC
jgi:hypothetical protein